MTSQPTKFKGRWRYEQILESTRKALEERFAEASREHILAKLIETYAAIEGIRYTLNALDSRGIGNGYSRGCIHASSDFFPDNLGDGDDGLHVFVTKRDAEGKIEFEPEDPRWDGKQDFHKADSLSIPCTTYVDDRVEIIAAHEQAMACYISGGSITFGDVRILQAVLNTPNLVLLESLAVEEKAQ